MIKSADCKMAGLRGLLYSRDEVVVLYCCPECPSCLAHLNSVGLAPRAIWVAIKKCSLSNMHVQEHTPRVYTVARVMGVGVGGVSGL